MSTFFLSRARCPFCDQNVVCTLINHFSISANLITQRMLRKSIECTVLSKNTCTWFDITVSDFKEVFVCVVIGGDDAGLQAESKLSLLPSRSVVAGLIQDKTRRAQIQPLYLCTRCLFPRNTCRCLLLFTSCVLCELLPRSLMREAA